MHRIDTSTAQKDKFGAGKNGFTRGNPQTGTPATDLDDDYFDMLQEELAGIIEDAGLVLDKSKHDQLRQALPLFLELGTVAKKNVGTGNGQIPDMSAFAFITGSTTAPGYTFLPNGLLLQWGSIPPSANEVTVSLPILFPNSFLNVYAASGYTVGSTAAAVASFGTAINPAVRGAFTARCTSPTIGGRYFAIGY